MTSLKTTLGSSLFLLANLWNSAASAAPVDIDTLYVDFAETTLTINNPFGNDTTLVASGEVIPQAALNMGTYQNDILSFDSSLIELTIYSTNNYGELPPSGNVDNDTINLDFSSLRANFSYNGVDNDFAVWPEDNILDAGIYSPIDNTFNVSWSREIMINIDPQISVSATLDVNLQGEVVTAVPVPGALILFSSGLLGVIGFSRRRKS